MSRSGAASNRWETAAEADRWFIHYTVLQTREHHTATSINDALLEQAGTPQAAAIVSAIRQLPVQQREAFLLHHGEQLELRQLATAMDCSSAATANHLTSALTTLRSLCAGQLDEFTRQLPAMMQQLTPTDQQAEFQIRRILSRRQRWVWFRRIRKWTAWLLLAVAVAVGAFVLRRIRFG